MNSEKETIYKLLSQLLAQFNPASNGFDVYIRDKANIK